MEKRSTITVDGQAWAYLRLGKGEPMVLLHGLLVNADFLLPLARALQNGYDVVIPDLPGTGKTAPLPGETTYQGIARSLAHFLNALGITRATAVGCSLGGAVAMSAAIQTPDLFTRLVVQGAPWRPSSAVIEHPFERLEYALSQLPTPILRRFQEGPVPDLLTTVLATLKPDLQKTVASYRNLIIEAMRTVDPDASKQIFKSLERNDIIHSLPQIRVPTLVVSGSDDGIVPAGEMRELATRLPTARFALIEGCGHELAATHPEEFARRIREFIAETQSGVSR